jgi:type II secretory pathway pseudopilin PulG
MSKKTLVAIAAVVVLALVGGGLYLAHVKRQQAIAAEEARKAAEEAARKEAEEKAEEVAEAPAQEENKSLSEQIEEGSKDAPESSAAELDEEEKKKLEIYNREFDEIEKLLTEYNRLDNTYDYRTVTLEQLLKAVEYLGNTYGHKEKYEKAMPERLERIKNRKSIREFDSIEIRTLIFTNETFEYPTDDYDNLTHAYVELEIRARQISPEEEFSNSLWKTWMQKIEGQWKVVGEEPIKELE